MGGKVRSWINHGRILEPTSNVHWLASSAASSGTLCEASTSEVPVYVAGRDSKNRSIIGRVVLDVSDRPRIVHVDAEPAFSFGELGAFDENGVSYPCPVDVNGVLHLYYTGWMPSVLTPFQNHIGLAVQGRDGRFERVSRAPILPRTNEDHLWLGSCYVMKDADRFRLWYTACLSWEPMAEGPPLHRYLIKYAESPDGRTWHRDNVVAIPFKDREEFAVARPSVLKIDGHYHMWFCSRGAEYRLGYAHSADGVLWERRDDALGFAASGEDWDRRAQCYPAVFRYQDRLFMLYNGNTYGRDGLGIAELRL